MSYMQHPQSKLIKQIEIIDRIVHDISDSENYKTFTMKYVYHPHFLNCVNMITKHKNSLVKVIHLPYICKVCGNFTDDFDMRCGDCLK